jgi:ribulose-phosphate 3-epimerase
LIIAPSILSGDFSRLAADCENVINAGGDWLHIDVMDGHFVPNISLGLPVIKSLRGVSDAFFDVHLMISRPDIYAARFCDAGADMLTFHIEADCNIKSTLEIIKDKGKKRGLVIKPATDPSAVYEYLPFVDMVLIMSVEPGFGGQKFNADAVGKIRQVRNYADRNDFKNLLIEVDGGINAQTAPLCIDAGADVLVAGSFIFGAKDRKKRIESLKHSHKEYREN